MLASYGTGWKRESLRNDWSEFMNAVVMNQICVSMASGASDSCASKDRFWELKDGQKGRKDRLMAPVDPERRARELCREEDGEARAIPIFAGDAEVFKKNCLQGIGVRVPAEKLPAVCAAVASRLDEPQAAAAAAAKAMGVDKQDEIDHIAHDLAVSRGLLAPKDCASPDPFKAEMCLAAWGYRHGDCGANALCLTLKGGGRASCEPYWRKAKAIFCRRAPGTAGKAP